MLTCKGCGAELSDTLTGGAICNRTGFSPDWCVKNLDPTAPDRIWLFPYVARDNAQPFPYIKNNSHRASQVEYVKRNLAMEPEAILRKYLYLKRVVPGGPRAAVHRASEEWEIGGIEEAVVALREAVYEKQ